MPSTGYYWRILIKTEIFSTDFRKITQIPNFMKIRRVAAELFSRGRTGRHDEANSRFRRFTGAPKHHKSVFIAQLRTSVRLHIYR
jgi:hypothetical protein